jgi:hypothetical protein
VLIISARVWNEKGMTDLGLVEKNPLNLGLGDKRDNLRKRDNFSQNSQKGEAIVCSSKR